MFCFVPALALVFAVVPGRGAGKVVLLRVAGTAVPAFGFAAGAFGAGAVGFQGSRLCCLETAVLASAFELVAGEPAFVLVVELVLAALVLLMVSLLLAVLVLFVPLLLFRTVLCIFPVFPSKKPFNHFLFYPEIIMSVPL